MQPDAPIITKKKIIKTALGVVIGGLLGIAFYSLIGCRTGGCALTSSPWATTALGSLAGGLIAWD